MRTRVRLRISDEREPKRKRKRRAKKEKWMVLPEVGDIRGLLDYVQTRFTRGAVAKRLNMEGAVVPWKEPLEILRDGDRISIVVGTKASATESMEEEEESEAESESNSSTDSSSSSEDSSDSGSSASSSDASKPAGNQSINKKKASARNRDSSHSGFSNVKSSSVGNLELLKLLESDGGDATSIPKSTGKIAGKKNVEIPNAINKENGKGLPPVKPLSKAAKRRKRRRANKKQLLQAASEVETKTHQFPAESEQQKRAEAPADSVTKLVSDTVVSNEVSKDPSSLSAAAHTRITTEIPNEGSTAEDPIADLKQQLEKRKATVLRMSTNAVASNGMPQTPTTVKSGQKTSTREQHLDGESPEKFSHPASGEQISSKRVLYCPEKTKRTWMSSSSMSSFVNRLRHERWRQVRAEQDVQTNESRLYEVPKHKRNRTSEPDPRISHRGGNQVKHRDLEAEQARIGNSYKEQEMAPRTSVGNRNGVKTDIRGGIDSRTENVSSYPAKLDAGNEELLRRQSSNSSPVVTAMEASEDSGSASDKPDARKAAVPLIELSSGSSGSDSLLIVGNTSPADVRTKLEPGEANEPSESSSAVQNQGIEFPDEKFLGANGLELANLNHVADKASIGPGDQLVLKLSSTQNSKSTWQQMRVIAIDIESSTVRCEVDGEMFDYDMKDLCIVYLVANSEDDAVPGTNNKTEDDSDSHELVAEARTRQSDDGEKPPSAALETNAGGGDTVVGSGVMTRKRGSRRSKVKVEKSGRMLDEEGSISPRHFKTPISSPRSLLTSSSSDSKRETQKTKLTKQNEAWMRNLKVMDSSDDPAAVRNLLNAFSVFRRHLPPREYEYILDLFLKLINSLTGNSDMYIATQYLFFEMGDELNAEAEVMSPELWEKVASIAEEVGISIPFQSASFDPVAYRRYWAYPPKSQHRSFVTLRNCIIGKRGTWLNKGIMRRILETEKSEEPAGDNPHNSGASRSEERSVSPKVRYKRMQSSSTRSGTTTLTEDSGHFDPNLRMQEWEEMEPSGASG